MITLFHYLDYIGSLYTRRDIIKGVIGLSLPTISLALVGETTEIPEWNPRILNG